MHTQHPLLVQKLTNNKKMDKKTEAPEIWTNIKIAIFKVQNERTKVRTGLVGKRNNKIHGKKALEIF